jgi:4'-phosphopantetheinyl transferase
VSSSYAGVTKAEGHAMRNTVSGVAPVDAPVDALAGATLAPGRIDVYLVDCDDGVHDVATLDAHERARHARFVTQALRDRFVAAHAATRRILGAYLRCSPQSVELERDRYGKPHVRGAALAFNLSHSDRVAAVAVAARAVGVDCERVDPATDWRALLPQVAHPAERIDERAAFYRVWARKEAVMKQRGLGFQLAPDRIEVPTSAGAIDWQRARIDGDAGPYVRDVDAPPGFVLAVAADARCDIRPVHL